MAPVLYKMVSFGSKGGPKQNWCDIVYAGADGSILVLLHKRFKSHGAELASAGDWYQLRQTKDSSNGRWHVLIRGKNDVKKRRRKNYVHHLVLSAWHGWPQNCVEQRPIKLAPLVGRHLDDNCANNSQANLAWGSKADNQADWLKNRKRRDHDFQGFKISLNCDRATWQIAVTSPDGRPIQLPPASSSRQTNPVRLLREALDEIRGDTAVRNFEKLPRRYCGHRPCPDYGVWMPADGFDEPDNAGLDSWAQENRWKEIWIEDVQGRAYEYIVKL